MMAWLVPGSPRRHAGSDPAALVIMTMVAA
jgi:hypothetical protein